MPKFKVKVLVKAYTEVEVEAADEVEAGEDAYFSTHDFVAYRTKVEPSSDS